MKKLLATLSILALLIGPPVTYAACTQALATSAKGGWLSGLFLKADTYKIAFYTSSATWSASTAQYAATNEIGASGNYPAGGFTLDTLAYGTSGTTYWMDWADEVNSTITFDGASNCAVIYDDTAASTNCTSSGVPWPCCSGSGAGTCDNAILGVWTFTSVQPSAGTLTVTFPAADASNAIIRIAFDGSTAPPLMRDDIYSYDFANDAVDAVAERNAAIASGRDPYANPITITGLLETLFGSREK